MHTQRNSPYSSKKSQKKAMVSISSNMTCPRYRANKNDIMLAGLKGILFCLGEHLQFQGILHLLLLKGSKKTSQRNANNNISLTQYVTQLPFAFAHIYFTSLLCLVLAAACCRHATLTGSVPGHCHTHQHEGHLPVPIES